MNLKKLFLEHCENKQYEINQNQIDIISNLKDYYKNNFNQSFLNKILKKKNNKLGYYLVGDVGVGKTMILNFFFTKLEEKKLRLHFNEFMIEFHNFIFQNKDKENGINNFVKDLGKKNEIIYFDEFQVTNIVDAMILGKLFETIFKEKIKVLISSNIKIDDLYKDGLQRDQFIPFLKIIRKFCIEHELIINKDYRKVGQSKLERFFFPLNEETTFHVNQMFRRLTKGKKSSIVKLEIKNRIFIVDVFFEGFARFNFNDLCSVNLGAEDYINIAEKCNFITLDNIPNFTDKISNEQQRFITLIDILYEKRISMMTSSNFNFENFTSSRRLVEPYKRTVSRLYELTSTNFNKN